MRFLTVTLNPAIDLVGETDELHIGGVNPIRPLSSHPAGKGINVAQVLRQLGADVTATGFLGADNAEPFERLLAEKQITNAFFTVNGSTRTNVKITSQQQTTDLNFTGFRVSEQEWQAFCQSSENWHNTFDCVAICGSLPQGITAEMFAQWCERLTAQGVCWVLDTSGQALAKAAAAQPFLLKPNDEELRIFAPDENVWDLQAQLHAAKRLCHGKTHYVLLSAGEKGAYLVDQTGNVLHALFPCQQLVSTTGAGDSLLGSFLAGLFAQKLTVKDALNQAVRIATRVVESPGIQWLDDPTDSRQVQNDALFIS